ncbi:MAG: ROK family transcriptional regulator [Chloroflexota bacterium]
MLNSAANKATTAHLKRHNETLLLRAIYATSAISRVDLSRETSLSRPSVSEITHNLIQRGLVLKVGSAPQANKVSKVGKKPTLLAFNGDAFQIIAIGVDDLFVVGALLDLRMQVIDQTALPINGALSTDLLQLVFAIIETLRDQATRPLLGIAVGTPGIIDSESGTVFLASNLGWKDLPLAQIISERFQTPVYVGNDSDIIAIGESRFGLAKHVKDVVVVKIGVGIGVGIISDGHSLRGHTFAAGDIGHTPFPGLDEICLCGRRGCLETVVSWWSLKRHLQNFIVNFPDSHLAQTIGQRPITPELLADPLFSKDSDTIALIDPVVTYLGYALLIIVHLLNPAMIILSGSMVKLGDPFFEQVCDLVRARAFPYMTREFQILANMQDERSILLGAGALLLEKELGL